MLPADWLDWPIPTEAVKGTVHVVGEGGFVERNLLQELVIASSLAAMATMLPPPLKSPARLLQNRCHLAPRPRDGHGVVLVVHAAGRLVALADADEAVEGIIHVVGLGQDGSGSPPIRVTAGAVFSVVGRNTRCSCWRRPPRSGPKSRHRCWTRRPRPRRYPGCSSGRPPGWTGRCR